MFSYKRFLYFSVVLVLFWSQAKSQSQSQSGCVEETWCASFKSLCTSNEYAATMKASCAITCGTCVKKTDPRCEGSNGGCEHACFVENDQVKCSCLPGYQLDSNGKNCSDIDECLNAGICPSFTEPFCVNRPGGYFCTSEHCAVNKGFFNRYRSSECCQEEDSPNCGRDGPFKRIVGGRDATPGGWPWMTYILINGGVLCGGTLISPSWVLTAGHCFLSADLSTNSSTTVKMFFGRIKSNARRDEEAHVQERDGVEIVLHPKFDKSKFPYNDIALIRVDRPVLYNNLVGPACLPNGEVPKVGTTCWAVGYGTTTYRGQAAKTLQEVDLPVVSDEVCAPVYAKTKYPVSKDIMFCAGHPAGGKDACQGDSGGALICQRCSSCGWYVAGVVSFGKGCARAGVYGVYTDVEKYEEWVAQYVGLTVTKDRVCSGTGPPRGWSRWSTWSTCSLTCSGGTQTRSRNCQRGRNGVVPCVGSDRGTRDCNTQKCPAWSNYGPWSKCDATCGGGKKTRTRTCIGGNVGDKGCVGKTEELGECNPQTCPFWSSWGSWSGCSVTCGGGKDKSTRTCNKVVSSASCSGSSTRTKDCNTQRCPYFTEWSSWGECSVSCGTGSQIKTRKCLNGNVGERGCHQGTETMSQPCNTVVCGTWDDWSTWTTCSVTCDGGNQSRKRACVGGVEGKGGCLGKKNEQRQCSMQHCPYWSDWSKFADCDVTCGGGKKQRTRVCHHGDEGMTGCHVGSAKMSMSCNTQKCPYFTQWSTWTKCSKTCATGQRTSKRECRYGNPGIVGCVGSVEKREDCNTKPCPTWNAFQPWSECSKTCGGGSQSRIRTCNNGVIPQTGCHNGASEKRNCNSQPCPKWTEWSAYSTCSKTCSEGKQARSRTCQHGVAGEDCPGKASEIKSCKLKDCEPVYEEYTPWSICSKTCGRGKQTRSRDCLEHCNAGVTETKDCNTNACPVLSDWTTWAPCSAKCGAGTRTRSRTCTGTSNPQDCKAALQGTEDCFQPCWGDWSKFSSCSVTCGSGTKTRTRTCSADPNDSSNTCQGYASHSESCGEPCPTSWGQWTQWTTCTATCNGGRTSRNRPCNGGTVGSPGCFPAKDGGQIRSCNEKACEAAVCVDVSPDCYQYLTTIFVTMCVRPVSEWTRINCPKTCNLCGPSGPWGVWGQCSESCGEGIHERVRSCPPGLLCNKLERQLKSCNLGPCAGYTQWSSWSKCTKTCGGGQTTRSRTCPPGIQCKPDLHGSALSQTESCNTQVCPGSWVAWSKWSTCSKSCDTGSTLRTRTCVGGSVGGPGCDNGHEQTKPCKLEACPGKWGPWEPVGQCSAQCGLGRITENRKCIGGEAGGTGCKGATSREVDCNLGACVTIWDAWAPWTKCSVTCGGGKSSRTRKCLYGAPGDIGCKGSTTENKTCNPQVCATGPCAAFTDSPTAPQGCDPQWCYSFLDYMQQHCKKTSCLCSANAFTQAPACQDKANYCAESYYLCENIFYKSMMAQNCQLTCNKC